MSSELDYHQIKDGTFLSHFSERAHIYFKHYIPKKESQSKKRIHLVFQHGMIEYHKRHEDFFVFLMNHLKENVMISVMDLLGHGLSGGHRAYVDHFDTFQKDMLSFLELCKNEFYNEPPEKTVLMGHSLGGLICLKTITEYYEELPFNIDSLVLVNPALAPKIELPNPIKSFLNKIPGHINQIRIPLIYDAYDLSHDNEKAKSFLHDHLISKAITLNLAKETLRAVKGINSASYFIEIPCFFLLSGHDKLVDNEQTKLFITGMDKSLVQVKYYPDMYHDLLNETCRSDVFKEIMRYIKK